MNPASIKRSIAALLLLLPLFSMGQEAQRPGFSDELWMSVRVRGRAPEFLKKPLGTHYRRIRLTGELGYRSADNFFAGRQLYAEVVGRYRLSKVFDVGVEYRYANRGANSPNRDRIQFIGGAGTQWNRFDLSYRFGYQIVFRGQDQNRTLLRNRFGVAYDIRKWKLDPEFDMEFFTRTDRPQGWNHIGTRYKLSTSFSPWKGHRFSPALVYDRDAFVADPVNRMIYSIAYTIDLRRL